MAEDKTALALQPDWEPLSEAEAEENGHKPGAASSVWEALLAKRAQLAGDRHLDLEVPGTFGMFSLRLGPISGQKQAHLSDRLQKSRSPERELNFNQDTLSAACQGVLARADRSKEWELMVDQVGEPIRLDKRLADAFGMPEGTTARQIVRNLYAGAPSPEAAITMASGEYLAWVSGITPELDEEALGEA